MKTASPVPQKRSKQLLEQMHGIKDALKSFNKIYPKDTFLRTSINNWKSKIKKYKEGKLFSSGKVNQVCFQMT